MMTGARARGAPTRAAAATRTRSSAPTRAAPLLSSLAVVVVVLLAAAPAAAASSPKQQQQQQQQQRPPEVYGFATATPDDPVEYDWSVLTTVAWRADPRTIAAAHAHSARVDYDGRAGAAEVVFNGSVSDAATWVLNTAGEVLRLGLDGVNFDLEQPIRGGAAAPEARAYTALVAATAAALQAATLGAARVTVDVPFLPHDNDGRNYDYLGLAAAADALFVMAYDTQALMWGRCVAAANAPLGLVERSVGAWLGLGVPAEKLVLGLPWYGYTYECLDDDDDGEEASASVARANNNNGGKGGGGGDARDLCRIAPVPYAGAPCSDAGGQQLGYAQIMELLDPLSAGGGARNVTPVRLEPLSTSLYFNYRDPAAGDRLRQVWFDDPSTLVPKMRVAARAGLRGVGFWNVDLLAYGDGVGERARAQTRAMWGAVAQVVAEWGAVRQQEEEEEERQRGGATRTAQV